MSASSDVFVYHTSRHAEKIQFKSSGNIAGHQPPDPDSKGILELGKETQKTKTIWGEFKKVQSSVFYSNLGEPKFFFIESNKPLKDYNEIKRAVDNNDVKNGLPPGVVVICHENFRSFAGSFAHCGFFQPINEHEPDTGDEECEPTLD